MIDFIKILLLEIDVARLQDLLDFNLDVSEKTGEYSTKKVANYHFCKIIIYENKRVLFTGSIHKLFNSLKNIKAPNYKPLSKDQIKNKVKDPYKGFNGNQFTLNNILEVRQHLETLFNCSPRQMLFQNIELGINTTPGFNPNLFLKGLLYHKSTLFEYRYNRNFAQAVHKRFIFKIYNKSHQYDINYHVLRIELKITKTEELKETGIRLFADINEDTLRKTTKMLLERFNEVMYYDYTIDKKNLTKTQKQLLINYSNPRYWIYDLKPNYRFRHKKRLAKIILKYSKNIHQQIRLDLIKKCSIINRISEHPKCSIINSSSIGLNMLQSHYKKTNRFCSITGIPLIYEKEGSKYIKTKTLKHLCKNNKEKFDEVCSLLLNNTTGIKPKFEKSLISHLSKQIRNKYYNQFKIKQTGYKQKKYFNQIELTI